MITYLLGGLVLALITAGTAGHLSRRRSRRTRPARAPRPVRGAGGQRLRTGDLVPGRRLRSGAVVLDGFTSTVAKTTNVIAVIALGGMLALGVWLWPARPGPWDWVLVAATGTALVLVGVIVAGSVLVPEAFDRAVTRLLPRPRGIHADHTAGPAADPAVTGQDRLSGVRS